MVCLTKYLVARQTVWTRACSAWTTSSCRRPTTWWAASSTRSPHRPSSSPSSRWRASTPRPSRRPTPGSTSFYQRYQFWPIAKCSYFQSRVDKLILKFQSVEARTNCRLIDRSWQPSFCSFKCKEWWRARVGLLFNKGHQSRKTLFITGDSIVSLSDWVKRDYRPKANFTHNLAGII